MVGTIVKMSYIGVLLRYRSRTLAMSHNKLITLFEEITYTAYKGIDILTFRKSETDPIILANDEIKILGKHDKVFSLQTGSILSEQPRGFSTHMKSCLRVAEIII